MNKPRLPIENGVDDYNSLRKELNQLSLSQECLEEIAKLFGVNNKDSAEYSCDEYHGHTYKCISFKRDETMIVDRLLQEIKMYQKTLREIREKIGEII